MTYAAQVWARDGQLMIGSSSSVDGASPPGTLPRIGKFDGGKACRSDGRSRPPRGITAFLAKGKARSAKMLAWMIGST